MHRKSILSLFIENQYSTCVQETNTQLVHRKSVLSLSTENQYSTCAQQTKNQYSTWAWKTSTQLVHRKPAFNLCTENLPASGDFWLQHLPSADLKLTPSHRCDAYWNTSNNPFHTHTPSTLREMRTKFHRVHHHYFRQTTFSVIMSEDPCQCERVLEMPGQWLVAICHYTGCEGDCFTPHFASSANTQTNDIRKLSMCKARMARLIRKPTQERFTVMTQKWFVEKRGTLTVSHCLRCAIMFVCGLPQGTFMCQLGTQGDGIARCLDWFLWQ